MKKKIRFVVNPFSGVSQKEDIPQKIDLHLDKNLFDYEIKFTEYAGHAIELSNEAALSGYDMVVAVGGDGSVNEVAQALVNKQTALGIIPAGSGNGFAGHIGISRNVVKAISVLNKGRAITIDSGRLNDHFFINAAGVGFDSYVAYQTKLKSARGLKVYVKGAMAHAFQYKSQRYQIESNDIKTNANFLSITLANGSILGYNFTIAPNADLQDGVLQMIKIRDAAKVNYFASLWRFFNKSIEKSNLIDVSTCTSATISSESGEMYYHIDGEGKIGKGTLSFSILPKSIRVWVP